MFSLKVAQDPTLQFRRKKFSKKIRLHGFFEKKFRKKRILSLLTQYQTDRKPLVHAF